MQLNSTMDLTVESENLSPTKRRKRSIMAESAPVKLMSGGDKFVETSRLGGGRKLMTKMGAPDGLCQRDTSHGPALCQVGGDKEGAIKLSVNYVGPRGDDRKRQDVNVCHLQPICNIVAAAAAAAANRLTPQENNKIESCQEFAEETSDGECPSRRDKLAGYLAAPQSCTTTIIKQLHIEQRPADQVDNCSSNNYNESQVNSTTTTTTTTNHNNNNFRLNRGKKSRCSLAAARPMSRINGQTVAHSSVLMLLLGILLSLLSSPSTTKLVNGARLQPEGNEKFYWSGETFVITCQNNNNIKNVKIRWRGPDGKYITENGTQRIHAESSGPHGNRLVVRNAVLNQDEGVYQCTINDVGDKRTPDKVEFTLKLLKSTSFKDTQRQLALTTGKRDHINCHVEFDPSVSPGTVTWYKDSMPIDMLNDSSIQVGEYNADTKLSQLTLSPVKREHEGTYKCQAIAVTPQLSKMSEFDIQLETRFAPIFDTSEQTIWVESGQAVASRLAAARLDQQQQQQQPATTNAHNKYKNQRQQAQAGRIGRPSNRLSQYDASIDQSADSQHSGNGGSGNGTGSGSADQDQRIIRVELKCTCQANPSASIMWFTEAAGTMAVMKGQPAHVVEQPTLETQGHNTTSTLIVAYNLDPNWPYRHDSYKCSAANTLGEAKKVFTIVQGNPPPSFSVGPNKSYNPQTALFEFTLLGPNYDPINPLSRLQQQQIINPPVDAFRIRAEFAAANPGQAPAASSASGASGSGAPNGDQTTLTRNADLLRRSSEPNVQWSYPIRANTNNADSTSGGANYRQNSIMGEQSTQAGVPYGPQNMTVNLGKLPSGLQRLYLEAHNAVGWSPNATYLGDFYLVSGASSSLLANGLGATLGGLQYITLLIVSWQTLLFARTAISRAAGW